MRSMPSSLKLSATANKPQLDYFRALAHVLRNEAKAAARTRPAPAYPSFAHTAPRYAALARTGLRSKTGETAFWRAVQRQPEASAEAVTQLRYTRFELNASVDAVDLLQLYEVQGVPLPPVLQQLARRYRFYYLAFGGQILVEAGRPDQLRVRVDFEPRRRSRLHRVKVRDLFPGTEWRTYAQASLAFGIDTTLGFTVPVSLQGVPFTAAAKVSAEARGSFILGPIDFSFKRAVVQGAGRGSPVVNWIVKKGELLEGGDLQFHLILQTLPSVSSVSADARMTAKVARPRRLPFIPPRMLDFSDKARWQVELPA